MKIKLTESKLKQIVAESVKKILREYDEMQFPEGYKGNQTLNSYFRNKNTDNLEDTFSGYDWEDSDESFFCQDEYDKMSAKLPGGGEQLDKLTKTNPIFKRWYKLLRKAQENKFSWDLYKRYVDDIKMYMDDERYTLLLRPTSFANENPNNWDNDNFDFDGRHPNFEPLHTSGSANRDLMNIDKQRKKIK
jgi:hypothetical protein